MGIIVSKRKFDEKYSDLNMLCALGKILEFEANLQSGSENRYCPMASFVDVSFEITLV